MLCKNCHAKPVCVIFKDVNKYADLALINIEECTHFSSKVEENLILKPSIGVAGGIVSGTALLNAAPAIKEYKDFNTKAPEKESDMQVSECGFCKSKATIVDKCDICGTEVCESCCNVDVFTNKKYCDACWENR